MLSPDDFFNIRVKHYFEYHIQEITNLLNLSRNKALALEKIREELIEQREFLLKYSFNDKFLTDLFRYHITKQFQVTYENNSDKPVKTFLEEVLPEIREEDEEEYNRYIKVESKSRYDIVFIKSAKKQEIVELLAKSSVIEQLWFQVSDFLVEHYKDDKKSRKRILYNEFENQKPKDIKKQIDPSFPDFRPSLKTIFSSGEKETSITINKTTVENGKKEHISLKTQQWEQEAYIEKLHKLLVNEGLISVTLTDFISHFTSEVFERIIWKGDDIELVYLMKELNINNRHIHVTTMNHFLNQKGNIFKLANLSSLKAQLNNYYPRIDKILDEMKKSA